MREHEIRKLAEAIGAQVAGLIAESAVDISDTVRRAMQAHEGESTFRFPIGARIVLTPYGSGIRASVGISYSAKSKANAVIEYDPAQPDMFETGRQ